MSNHNYENLIKMRLSKEIFYVLLTEMLILIPSVAHIALSSRITSIYKYPLCIISGIFLFLDTFFLFATVLKDPGRMPKKFTSADAPIVIEIRDQTFTMSPCPTCKTLKDLRTHHCKICDFCVDRLDHHCPWVANCIGRRNHRHFILLLISATLHSVYMITVSALEIAVLHPPPGNYGGEIILIIFSVVLGWSLASLLGYQSILIINNQTTHENRRKLFQKNPFSGSVWRNCTMFWSMKKDEVKIVTNSDQC